MLLAACLALNQGVRVQIPPVSFGLHWSSSGEDSAFVMRQRGFESHPVLSASLTIRLQYVRAHDVAVAYRLAMADVRVRLPLGTWLSARSIHTGVA